MSEKRRNEIVFIVPNKHPSGIGMPPTIDAGVRKRYYGYFENEFSDQFIFVYDYEVQEGTLWAGDAGWENSFPVRDGDVQELMLGANERAWLRTCWDTAVSVLPK